MKQIVRFTFFLSVIALVSCGGTEEEQPKEEPKKTLKDEVMEEAIEYGINEAIDEIEDQVGRGGGRQQSGAQLALHMWRDPVFTLKGDIKSSKLDCHKTLTMPECLCFP